MQRVRYLEVKQLPVLLYCQTMCSVFFLSLKGSPFVIILCLLALQRSRAYWIRYSLLHQIFVSISQHNTKAFFSCTLIRKRNTTITMDSYHERSFNFWKYCVAILENYWWILDERWLDMKIICCGPKVQNQTHKGFSYFELKKSDLARSPICVIDITTENYGYITVIIVTNDNVKG